MRMCEYVIDESSVSVVKWACIKDMIVKDTISVVKQKKTNTR